MGLKDEYDFENLINEAESLVLKELEAQIGEADELCTCQDCVLDMAAFALNNVKPYYRVSLMGTLYARATTDQTEYGREIKKAVREAIKKVHANPSHD
jgi:competence protein ComFB